METVLTASSDRNDVRLRVNAILDKFRNSLKGITLRQCNYGDGIPVVADL